MIQYTVTPHVYVNPGNLIAENYGEHMVSLKIDDLAEDLGGYVDNGVIVKVGDMVSLDQWDCELAEDFDGYIALQGVDGTWLVVVDSVEDDKTALIYQKPLIDEESPRALTELKNFTNDPEDGPVRGYIIHPLDRWFVDEDGFEGIPAKGAKITGISAEGKLVIDGTSF